MQDVADCKRFVLAFCRTSRKPIAFNQIVQGMKLTLLLLLVGLLNAKGNIYGQQISLNITNQPLGHVCSAIEKQSNYVFFISSNVDKAKSVTIKVQSASIDEVLKLLLKDLALDYAIKGKTITIIKREQKHVPVLISNLTPPITIRGRVLNEDGVPLEGITVQEKGTTRGTSTNVEGDFFLDGVNDNAILSVSGANIETTEIKVGRQTILAITVKTKISSLNEVVINKGYYTEKQRYSVSNVGKITSAEIERQPVSNPLLALQGRIPGLYIAQSNGISGGGITIQIIGQNSIASRNDPLYVIDGVPYFSQNLATFLGGSVSDPILGKSLSSGPNGNQGNPLSYINALDIESIEVLKDADATAIYGSRAANGVILITTKKAKRGDTKVDINVQQGWSKVGSFMDLLNAPQYLEMRREAIRNDNANVTSTDYDLNGEWDTTHHTDWQKELIGRTAKLNIFSLGISGGSTNLRYILNGTYRRESTVFPGDFSNSNASVHFNVNSTSLNDRFNVQFSGTFMATNSNLPGRDFTKDIFLAPVAPKLHNDDGTLNWESDANQNSTWFNPLANIQNQYDNKVTSLVGNAVFSYKIIPGLNIKTNIGYTMLTANEFVANLIGAIEPERRPNITRFANFTFNSSKSWIVEPQLSYNKAFRSSTVDIIAGTSIQQQENDGKAIEAYGQPDDQLLRDMKSATSFFSNASDISTYKYLGVYGRINYILSNKYLFNAVARRDGSSRFGDQNKFNSFGSLGLGWIFTEEKWIKKNISFISFGKVRGSYGTTGNDQISDYRYLNLFNSIPISNPYQGIVSLTPTRLTNQHLQWEETKKLQAGIELGFIEDKIFVTATRIINRSSNQLLQDKLPIITGFNNIAANFPALVQNSAWEFTLGISNVKISNSFTWTSNANLTIPRSKLVDFPNLSSSTYSNQLIIGHPLDLARTVPFVGVDPTTGIYVLSDKAGNATSTPSYPQDYTLLYSPSPRYYGGFQNSIKFKGFEIDFLLSFFQQRTFNIATGNIFIPGNFSSGSSLSSLGTGNQPTLVLSRWQKNGDNTTVQRYSADFSLYDFFPGSRDLQNIHSIKLKNASISYQVPKDILQKIHLKSCKIFANAQNVFTITNYKGLDPENMSLTSLPPLRVITVGLQVAL